MIDYGPDTALIVVDVQNDFADPKGSLYVRQGEQVVPIANREIERAAAAGSSVFYTQDWHPPDTPHFQRDGGIWPVHCVRETWGAQFHPDLKVMGEVVRKGAKGEDGYSGFCVRDPVSGEAAETVLGARLRALGIRSLAVLGLAGDYCVGATAKDGHELGWPVSVLRKGVRFVELNPGDEARTWRELAAAGVEVVG
jgi:nicotinamidase/pyrazinamidase